ncbi:hypothetical protein DFH28DRAFT_247372 [Melampsora americana]|nr:hypothetical protein DFH28DRAFT_247372 [Melampsora americana]
MRNGEIRISQIDPISGNPSVKQIGQIEDFHTNSIHCLKFIKLKKPKDSIPTQSNSNPFKLTIDIQDEFQEFIISCSLNGDVKIWSTTKSTSHQSSNCLGTIFLNNQADGLVNEIGTCISFNLIQDSKYQNILAIGTQTGSIHYWIGLSFFDRSNPNIFSTTRQYECINRLKNDVFQSVKYLEIESWKTLKPSILVQRGSHNFFERHWILNPSNSKDGLNFHAFLKYGTDLDSLGSLTCLDQDFHYPFQSNPDLKPINRVSKSSKVFNHSRWNSKGTEEETLEDHPSSNRVVAGDHQGKSYLWSWTREDFEVLLPSIKPPLICLQESGSLVTSICMTPMLIGIGGEDGSTKVYDALTGELLRLFRDKKSSKERSRLMNRGRLSEEEIEEVNEVYKVRSIELRSDSIVIGFGEWIMAWQVDRCGVQHKQKKEIRSKGAGRVVSKRIGSSNLQEIKDEVANRRERERIESELRSKEERWIERYHGELSEWMNEDEVFEYMKMISMEESHGNDHQVEEEWETWEMEEEEGEEGEERVLIDREDEEDEEARRLVIRASGSGEGDLKGNELNLKDWPMMNERKVRSQSSQSQNQNQSESAWKKDWIEVED